MINMRVDQDSTHFYVLLKWKKSVPECFHTENLQLTEGIRVGVIFRLYGVHPRPNLLPRREMHFLTPGDNRSRVHTG